MRNAKAFATVSVALVLNGCVFFSSRMPVTGKICSDSPQNAIMTFLKGISEYSLVILKMMVLDGVNILTVFGDGSIEQGRKVVQSIVDHPEIRRGNEVDSVYSLVAMTGEGSEREILIERRAQVMFMNENMRVEDEVYRRSFRVIFHPLGHCILAVRPIDAGWIRMVAPASAC